MTGKEPEQQLAEAHKKDQEIEGRQLPHQLRSFFLVVAEMTSRLVSPAPIETADSVTVCQRHHVQMNVDDGSRKWTRRGVIALHGCNHYGRASRRGTRGMAAARATTANRAWLRVSGSRGRIK